MSGPDERHARPENEPTGGLVRVLSRWEGSGGHWRILSETEGWLTVGLFTCDGGDLMSRVTGSRTAVLRCYLSGRTSNEGSRRRLC